MKYISLAVFALLACSTQATVLQHKSTGDDIWGETLEAGLDASTYLKDSPKAYQE